MMIRVLPLISLLLGLNGMGLENRAQAAPVPGTSSSPLISSENGVYHSQIGFKMSAEGTDWLLSPLPAGSKYLLTLYRSPESYQNVQASLSVRVDRLPQEQELKSYVRKWLRQYPRFGFEVLGTKGFRSKGKLGYVIDLVNRGNEKQLRQVVFMKDQSAIVMTCRDHIDNFRNSLKSCNQIIRSFEWTSQPEVPQLAGDDETSVNREATRAPASQSRRTPSSAKSPGQRKKSLTK